MTRTRAGEQQLEERTAKSKLGFKVLKSSKVTLAELVGMVFRVL